MVKTGCLWGIYCVELYEGLRILSFQCFIHDLPLGAIFPKDNYNMPCLSICHLMKLFTSVHDTYIKLHGIVSPILLMSWT